MAKMFERLKSRGRGKLRRWADYLQKQSECLSRQGKKVALFFFCILFSGSNLVVIVRSIAVRNKAPVVHAGKLPRLVRVPEQPALPFISKQEYDRIEQFKNYVRQLPKAGFDSFMRARPKLLDSIAVIENYYLSQNKK